MTETDIFIWMIVRTSMQCKQPYPCFIENDGIKIQEDTTQKTTFLFLVKELLHTVHYLQRQQPIWFHCTIILTLLCTTVIFDW